MVIRLIQALVLCAVTLAASANAQDAAGTVERTVAVGSHFQTFSFGKDGDVDRASLLLLPITFQARLNSRTALDGYGAYAAGSIAGNGKYYTLDGPVDSWLRIRWAANSWAVIAAGIALPTGVSSHTGTEAAVSNALASDLLGFREATWGGPLSGTFGVSTVHHVGATKVTFGTSYRTGGSFQPSVDTTLRYAPGDEVRLRAGIEKRIAGGALSFGGTLHRFSVDKADARNLFQSGDRIRGDLSYSHGGWGFFAANLWRAQGDLIIPIINAVNGSIVRDTTVTVGWQNLVIGGASGTVRIRESLIVVPSVDIKVRTREDAGGGGWLASGGIVMPVRALSAEMFPSLKMTYGSIYSSTRTTFAQQVVGVELGMVMRRAFLR